MLPLTAAAATTVSLQALQDCQVARRPWWAAAEAANASPFPHCTLLTSITLQGKAKDEAEEHTFMRAETHPPTPAPLAAGPRCSEGLLLSCKRRALTLWEMGLESMGVWEQKASSC